MNKKKKVSPILFLLIISLVYFFDFDLPFDLTDAVSNMSEYSGLDCTTSPA